MMTNKQKQRAEEIRQELAPLYKECEKLAKIYNTAGANYDKLYRVRYAWQTVGSSGHARDTFGEEEAQKMEEMRRNNPHEWRAHYEETLKAEREAEEVRRVAYINFKNYLAFIARRFSSMLGNVKEWQEHKAAQNLADFLQFGDSSSAYSLRLIIKNDYLATCAACCLHEWAEDYEAQGIDAPHRLTVAKYRATLKKLKALEEKAEELALKIAKGWAAHD